MKKQFKAASVTLIITFIVLSLFILPVQAYIVSDDWAQSIDDFALGVDRRSGAEIVVCVFPSLTGHGILDKQGHEITDIVELSVHIFNEEPLETFSGDQVGIGKAEQDNGVLLVLAIDEQQWRIEVGYGLEGYITDIESNQIVQQNLVPQMQQGNYGEAIYDTVEALAGKIPDMNQTASPRGYYFYESDTQPTQAQAPWWAWIAGDYYGLPLWLIVVLLIIGVAVPVFGGGRSRGGRSGGGGSSGKW
jgi:hypothetical protein